MYDVHQRERKRTSTGQHALGEHRTNYLLHLDHETEQEKRTSTGQHVLGEYIIKLIIY